MKDIDDEYPQSHLWKADYELERSLNEHMCIKRVHAVGRPKFEKTICKIEFGWEGVD